MIKLRLVICFIFVFMNAHQKKIYNINEAKNAKVVTYPQYYESAFVKPLPQSIDPHILTKAGISISPDRTPIDWNSPVYHRYPGECYVAYFKNSCIAPNGTIFNDDEQILLELPRKDLIPKFRTVFNKIPPNINHIRKVKHPKLVHLFQNYTEFYHWLVEALPRLSLVYDQISHDKSIKILLHENTPYISQYLQILNISPSQCIFSNKKLYMKHKK